jgi:DNA replication licensing factor MCM6
MASVMMSDAITSDHAPMSSRMGTPRARTQRGSSARPRGPPSESVAGPHSDDEGFADDQTLNGRPKKKDRAIPRVIDPIGAYVQSNFEDFLEQFVLPKPWSAGTNLG